MVFNHRNRLLGTGYYNPHSPIAARLMCRHECHHLDELLRERILSALTYRESLFGSSNTTCRLVHSEGDHLPGLIVDGFGSWLVIQVLTAGIDAVQDSIIEVLRECLQPEGIVLRNDSPYRQLEGLPLTVDLPDGHPPSPLIIESEGLRFAIDLCDGQKTGHFYDQSFNRLHLSTMVSEYRVFDGYCYSGGWALQAARGGARSVVAVDSSEGALALAQRNARLNGFEQMIEFRRGDVIDSLRRDRQRGIAYDCIIVDPPAFAKSRRDKRQAAKGYLKLNREAIRALHPGGLLVTSSCSYHMSDSEYLAIIAQATSACGRTARVVHHGTQAPDHPVSPAVPETSYLKCFFLRVD